MIARENVQGELIIDVENECGGLNLERGGRRCRGVCEGICRGRDNDAVEGRLNRLTRSVLLVTHGKELRWKNGWMIDRDSSRKDDCWCGGRL